MAVRCDNFHVAAWVRKLDSTLAVLTKAITAGQPSSCFSPFLLPHEIPAAVGGPPSFDELPMEASTIEKCYHEIDLKKKMMINSLKTTNRQQVSRLLRGATRLPELLLRASTD